MEQRPEILPWWLRQVHAWVKFLLGYGRKDLKPRQGPFRICCEIEVSKPSPVAQTGTSPSGSFVSSVILGPQLREAGATLPGPGNGATTLRSTANTTLGGRRASLQRY